MIGSPVASRYTDLRGVARQCRNSFAAAEPFPHVVFDGFFDPQVLGQVADEFPDLAAEKSIRYANARERKLAGVAEYSFGPATTTLMRYLNSAPFLKFLQRLTRFDEQLIPDPFFDGGGLHEVKRGGVLKVHVDFNKHKQTGLDRRLNMITYLNQGWTDEYGGHLELWDADMTGCQQRVRPDFNTVVIFATSSHSFHGLPDPVTCPEDLSRRSLATYYYSNGRPQAEIDPYRRTHGTRYVPRPANAADAQAFS